MMHSVHPGKLAPKTIDEANRSEPSVVILVSPRGQHFGWLEKITPGSERTHLARSRAIVDLHDTFFSAIHQDGRLALALSDAVLKGRAAEHLKAGLKQIVQDAIQESPFCALGESRAALVLPVWIQALEELGQNPRVALTHEDPLLGAWEPGMSANLTPPELLHRYLQDLMGLERMTRGRARALVARERHQSNPVRCLGEISQALGLNVIPWLASEAPAPSTGASAASPGFMTRWTSSPTPSPLSDLAGECHLMLLNARGAEDETEHKMNFLSARLSSGPDWCRLEGAIHDLLAEVAREKQNVQIARGRLVMAEDRIAALTLEAEQNRRAQENDAQQMRAALDAKILSLADAEDSLRSKQDELRFKNSLIEERLAALQSLEAQLADATARASERGTQLISVNQSLEETRRQLEESNAAHDAAVTEYERRIRNLETGFFAKLFRKFVPHKPVAAPRKAANPAPVFIPPPVAGVPAAPVTPLAAPVAPLLPDPLEAASDLTLSEPAPAPLEPAPVPAPVPTLEAVSVAEPPALALEALEAPEPLPTLIGAAVPPPASAPLQIPQASALVPIPVALPATLRPAAPPPPPSILQISPPVPVSAPAPIALEETPSPAAIPLPPGAGFSVWTEEDWIAPGPVNTASLEVPPPVTGLAPLDEDPAPAVMELAPPNAAPETLPPGAGFSVWTEEGWAPPAAAPLPPMEAPTPLEEAPPSAIGSEEAPPISEVAPSAAEVAPPSLEAAPPDEEVAPPQVATPLPPGAGFSLWTEADWTPPATPVAEEAAVPPVPDTVASLTPSQPDDIPSTSEDFASLAESAAEYVEASPPMVADAPEISQEVAETASSSADAQPSLPKTATSHASSLSEISPPASGITHPVVEADKEAPSAAAPVSDHAASAEPATPQAASTDSPEAEIPPPSSGIRSAEEASPAPAPPEASAPSAELTPPPDAPLPGLPPPLPAFPNDALPQGRNDLAPPPEVPHMPPLGPPPPANAQRPATRPVIRIAPLLTTTLNPPPSFGPPPLPRVNESDLAAPFSLLDIDDADTDSLPPIAASDGLPTPAPQPPEENRT